MHVQAAELVTLRRVDPVKAYPLAVDFERIAVDHCGDAGHVGGTGPFASRVGLGAQGVGFRSVPQAAPFPIEFG